MRTLALLLLLLNMGGLIWQLGLLPMLPWQPEQFNHVIEYSNSDANDLPRLVLLNEHQSNIADAENDQATVALTRLPASGGTTSSPTFSTSINDIQAKKSPLTPIQAINHSTKPVGENQATSKNTTVSSTLQQAAGLPLSHFDKSKDKEIAVASTTELKQTKKSLACFQIGAYSYLKATQKIANWLKKQKNVSVKLQNRQTQVLKSTWVYLPSFESRTAARRNQQRLNQQGIKDLEKLIALGYKNVKSQKRYKSQTKYWLNVKIHSDQSQLLNTFKKKFKGSELESVTCE